MDIKEDFRYALRETKWKAFLRTKGKSADLDDVEYCVYSLNENRQPHIIFHTFKHKSEDYLLKYGYKLAQNWKKHNCFLKYSYIYKYRVRRNERYIILIDGKSAFRATIPTLIICVLLVFVGLILFRFCAQILSRWMVKPIEDMINSEKKFISNASHELKTPLAVISANTELLSSEIGTDNKHLTYIQQETSRMIALVQKMLTLTRLDAPQIQETHAVFPIDEALYDIIYPMESVAYEKHLSLETDIQEHIKMDGNEEQIQNLVSILLNNAISYTPEHGTIGIHAHVHNRKFYLSVDNTGDPIPEEMRDRLFERFFRADEARADNGHFGLGLSIAHSIVMNHSGKITVERQGDKNVFSVTLPVVYHK